MSCSMSFCLCKFSDSLMAAVSNSCISGHSFLQNEKNIKYSKPAENMRNLLPPTHTLYGFDYCVLVMFFSTSQ